MRTERQNEFNGHKCDPYLSVIDMSCTIGFNSTASNQIWFTFADSLLVWMGEGGMCHTLTKVARVEVTPT